MRSVVSLSRMSGLLVALLLLSVGVARVPGADVPPATSGGYLFTEDNASAGNNVWVYHHGNTGTLQFVGTFSTTGTGTGAELNSSGPVGITANHKYVYAVNPGSNDITAFSFSTTTGLTFINKISSGGTTPVSLTINPAGTTLFVVNFGGTPNITGFSIGTNGALTAVPGATSPLSGVNVSPTQVSFNPTGTLLVVTELKSGNIDTYTLRGRIPSAPFVQVSHGRGPFGFAFDNHGFLIVSEDNMPGSGVSSYSVSPTGQLTVITGSLVDGGLAACWIVNTNNKTFPLQYSYTSNSPSSTISGFQIATDGSLTLLNPSTGITFQFPSGSYPLDMVTDIASNYLYALDNKGGGQPTANITGFKINSDGSLTQITIISGIPKNSSEGLVGY